MRLTLAALCTGAILLGGPAAVAQDVYRLGNDDEWALEARPAPDSAAAQLSAARELLAAGRADRALNMANRWLVRNPTSALLPEAHLIRADAYVALGDEYEALYDYEYLVRKYPGSEVFTIALDREYDIAVKYAHGMKRKVFGLRIADATDEGEELLIRIQERLPGSRLAERAGLQLADMYFRQRRMELAAEAYSIFIERYPRSTEIPFARRRLIYANIATYKGPEFDIVGLLEAKVELQQLSVVRPAEAERIGAHALVLRIVESEATKILTTGLWYDDMGDPIAAELTLRNLVQRHPRSVAASKALDRMPAILAQLPESVLKHTPDYSTFQTMLSERKHEPDADAPEEASR